MRSRYAAYVLQEVKYLRETWHSDTRPEQIEPEPGLQWLGLKIISAEAGKDDNEAWVEFIARYKSGGRAGQLQERSRFLRIAECWYYVEGEIKAQPDKQVATSRNAPCPCGSGKKFKRCCGL
jgi:SEC-C motif-containing protein